MDDHRASHDRFEMLHFRDADWARVSENATQHVAFALTQQVGRQVKERLWKRYTTVPDGWR